MIPPVSNCDRCKNYWKDARPIPGVVYNCSKCASIVLFDKEPDQQIKINVKNKKDNDIK